MFAPSITVTNEGTINSMGDAGSGIFARSAGADGVADQTVDDTTSAPNNHYMGRNGGTVQVTNDGTINVQSGKSAFQIGYGGLSLPLNAGIDARSAGGNGKADATGNRANGPGGDAGNVTTGSFSAINLSGATRPASMP